MSVMADIQRQQADVQQMQVKYISPSMKSVSLNRKQSTRLHEQRLVEQAESMRVHEQRMSHIDMRLAEITDKLDGLIGFQRGQFPDPK